MQQRRRRSGIIVGLLSLGLLAMVALTGNSAQAASGPGPYYAEPAWDRKLPAATRFVVLTDWNSEAVLDRETGLVWERSPVVTQTTWSAARLACTARTTGTRKGWRLPSMHELTSLVNPFVFPGPTLPPGNPFLTVQLDGYWSATTEAGNPTRAWLVFFDDGTVTRLDKTVTDRVWCVRGGMNAEAY